MFSAGHIRHTRRHRTRAAIETLENRTLLATFVVTNAGNDPAFTSGLRFPQALAQANGNPGPDTIIFDLSPEQQTADIISVHGPLTISGDLIIIGPTEIHSSRGPNARQIVINSAQFNQQLFKINSGVDVTIANVYLAGGNGDQPRGAAVDNAGNLTLQDVQAVGIIDGNSPGGTIYNTGDLTISRSLLRGFTNGEGGVIYSESGSVRIENTTIDFSLGDDNGGAIYFNSGTGVILNSTIVTNEAAFGAGGGLYINDANNTDILVHNSIIAGNTSFENNVRVPSDIFGTLNPASSFNIIGDA
ncbi:MAG: hypothetical protein KDA80_14130, partial [Planctomycetaceae bacterium]|nr:hypothetical protein [Planctomycetaceae bacterium]